MKRILILLVMMLSLVGCQGNNAAKDTAEENAAQNTTQNTANATTAETEESSDTVKIGVLKFIDHVSLDAAKEGFLEKLDEEGIKIELVDLSANGDISLITTLAEKLKGEEVDLIYAIATPSAQGVKNVITDTPIVFSAVTDPVGAGLVKDAAAPEGNITGVSDYVDPSGQIDEFLKLYPDVKTFGVLYSTSEQNSQVQVEELEKTLNEKGLSLEKVGVNNVNDITQAIASLAGKIDALFALTDNLVANAAPIVSENLLQNNIPSLSSEEGQVKEGLLMSEGVNYKAQGAQTADMAIKILKGEEIKNLPVEENKVNTKLVNGETAERLGLDLSNPIFEGAEIIK